eukprot:GILK01009783.1.p1 GENE.GILK01009783.1~~GILK01009783.1.p1  ORF type:complete len:385 (-),score=30.56 GILK01009783.1:46-1200(-)
MDVKSIADHFPEVLDTSFTHVARPEDPVDQQTLAYLNEFFQEMQLNQPGTHVVPVRVNGDGNCLLNAVSVAIWGSEDWSSYLRPKLVEELTEHKAWYGSKLEIALPGQGSQELESAIACAQQEGAFLTNLHIVALSHVIRRPIILLASRTDMGNLGVGYHGCSGTFLPCRSIESADMTWIRPVVVAWSSDLFNHFVPLLCAQGSPPAGFPVPTNMQGMDTGASVDPFAPPYIPEIHFDRLCRSCPDVYNNCWDAPLKPFPAALLSHVLHPTDIDSLRGLDQAMAAIGWLRSQCSVQEAVGALQALHQITRNLVNSEDRKYREINTENPNFKNRVGRFEGGIMFLQAIGFECVADSNLIRLSKENLTLWMECAFELDAMIKLLNR